MNGLDIFMLDNDVLKLLHVINFFTNNFEYIILIITL